MSSSTIDWIRADWSAPANIQAGTTLRRGGVSRGEYSSLNIGLHVADEPAAVAENRRRFVKTCGLPSEPRWLRQIHGVNVTQEGPAHSDPGTDAIVCRSPGIVCAVLTADCLPVLFAANDGSEVACAHAGWRGLCEGILEATVAGMETPAPAVVAWLGPAIAQPAFEVGAEVRAQFVKSQAGSERHFVRNARGRYQADLYGLARQRLERAGVTAVTGGEHCTFAEAGEFFSYRRDGRCGRMATFIYRK